MNMKITTLIGSLALISSVAFAQSTTGSTGNSGTGSDSSGATGSSSHQSTGSMGSGSMGSSSTQPARARAAAAPLRRVSRAWTRTRAVKSAVAKPPASRACRESSTALMKTRMAS
jgi:hypothetical protein